MEPETDLAALAREIIDSNQYMTLATADADGRPWASPVWFAHERYTEFVWVSKPETRHSRNLSARGQAGIVIFDSTVPVGGARAVYLEASVERLEEDEAEHHIAVFSDRSQELGGVAWGVEEISAPAPLRLYRASASAHYVLGKNDERIAVSPG
jgi:nitroimidazol reductase NimA-like FMN-containing flavoprotein (pyridoxamine 5'-phosphate oxidase superfamily)